MGEKAKCITKQVGLENLFSQFVLHHFENDKAIYCFVLKFWSEKKKIIRL